MSNFPFIPKAFRIPSGKEEFLKESRENPDALWLQKSNHHRRIKIVNVHGVRFKSTSKFLQRFVDNPLLIDDRKFDIGVYVIITSVDPLRVYIYEEEISLRFCTTDYHPFDVKDESKYIIVGGTFTSPHDMPSLNRSYNIGQFSAKEALFAHMKKQGADTKLLWSKIKNIVRQVYQSKELLIAETYRHYTTSHNFFELVRFDFLIDDLFNVWLMEVNMSPNLSSNEHPEKRQLFEQVIYNTLKIVGTASYLMQPESIENQRIEVTDRDISVDSQHCADELCHKSCDDKKCELCHQCLNDFMKLNIKNAYLEHINRGSFRRVAPQPLDGMDLGSQLSNGSTENNAVLALWFREKCKQDLAWCQ